MKINDLDTAEYWSDYYRAGEALENLSDDLLNNRTKSVSENLSIVEKAIDTLYVLLKKYDDVKIASAVGIAYINAVNNVDIEKYKKTIEHNDKYLNELETRLFCNTDYQKTK